MHSFNKRHQYHASAAPTAAEEIRKVEELRSRNRLVEFTRAASLQMPQRIFPFVQPR